MASWVACSGAWLLPAGDISVSAEPLDLWGQLCHVTYYSEVPGEVSDLVHSQTLVFLSKNCSTSSVCNPAGCLVGVAQVEVCPHRDDGNVDCCNPQK